VNSKSNGVKDDTKQDEVISQIKDYIDTSNINDVDEEDFD
jgi:hypothetical protein